MAKFTFLEIHLDDASLAANAPLSGSTERDDGGEEGESGGGSGGRLGLLVGLVVLVALSYAVKRRLDGEGTSGGS